MRYAQRLISRQVKRLFRGRKLITLLLTLVMVSKAESEFMCREVDKLVKEAEV